MRIVLEVILGTILLILYSCIPIEGKDSKNVPKHVRVVYVEVEKKVDWDKFIEALIHVESTNNPKAFNKKTNAAGVLQIRKSVVDDCNRILKRNAYTMEDRFDRQKSIQMFNIIQNHYNKDKDFHFALKIWNSKASFSYHTKVLNKYNELINE